tara:strand:- start:2761 stop:4995 length:2235 start_codon:yes stop_codon:yes gene_type:complete
MSQAISIISKSRKSVLLGTSALVCLALATPVMADDFVITSSDGSTNGVGTTNGATAAAIAADAIDGYEDGSDTVSLGIALKTTGTNEGILTTNVANVVDGNTVTVTETGSIETTGNFAYGISNRGNENETTVSGSIETAGDLANGINNFGDSNETTVSGSITTAGDVAHGIYNEGSGNETTVSGSIETAEEYSRGIFNDGNNNITTVSGSIKTGDVVKDTGEYAQGIYNAGDSNETTVSGSITTDEKSARGIYNGGASNITTVSGSIETAGFQADGIINDGNKNETTVSGSITTTGERAHGIYNFGDTNTNTISGTVKATGARSAALYNVKGDGNSFTLNEGATIIGDILARDDTGTNFDATNSKLIFNLGASTSYAYSVSGKGAGTGAGQWDFSDLDRSSQVVTTTGTGCATDLIAGNTVCNLVTGVSTGNLEAQDELQFSMNSSMIGSLELGSSNSAAPTEAMSSTQTPQSNAWFNIYGDTSERSTSTTKLAFEGSNRGLTIGTPVAISDTLNLDVVFNASNANLDIGSAKEQEITVESYNIGAVLRDLVPSDAWSVDAFGFLGSNSYEGKRKVMNNQKDTGSETVTAAYSGMKVLLGVDAQYSNPINDTLNFTGGLNANLSNEKIEAYSESKYYSWDARTMLQAAGGINLGLEHNKDALTTFASLGLQHSSLQKGKTATYTNNGTAGSFIDNATSDTRRSATVGFSYKASDNISFKGAVEAFTSENGVDGNSANLRINWAF